MSYSLSQATESNVTENDGPPKSSIENAVITDSYAIPPRSPSIVTRPRGQSAAVQFRRPSLAAGDSQTVSDVYRKQASTISDLTEEKDKLAKEAETLKEKLRDLGKLMVDKDKKDEQFASIAQELQETKSRAQRAEVEVAENKDELERLVSVQKLVSNSSLTLSEKDDLG